MSFHPRQDDWVPVLFDNAKINQMTLHVKYQCDTLCDTLVHTQCDTHLQQIIYYTVTFLQSIHYSTIKILCEIIATNVFGPAQAGNHAKKMSARAI